MDRDSLAPSGREGNQELRECRSCYATGYVLLDASYDALSGELVREETPCPICRSVGRVDVFLYATPRRRSR